MLYVTNHEENVNQNHNDTIFHSLGMSITRKTTTTENNKAGEYVKESGSLCVAVGNVKLYSHCRKQYGS